MSLYLEQIRQLVALQRVDDAIHSVEMELEQAPKELEDLKNRFAATNTQRERVLEKLAHLKEQEKRITGELDDDSSRIKKSKNKMMQVSNSREYQAMAREMDNMEKVNRSREEERAALLEEKLHQDNALQEVDAIWADLKAELEAKQISLETRQDEARKRLDELAQVRSETGSAVPRPVLDRYEFIRRRLRLDYQPLDRTVVTDAKWLGFVVEQVLSNALKYTVSGSVTIAMDGDDLCIRDTGMGIAPEDLPRIFDRGVTGLNGRRDTRASGIGLYLCRRICRSLGHTIRASSVPNQGTEIRIGLGQKKTLPE